MFITILLLGVLLFGLILLAVGVVLLIKVKNKLAGFLAIAVGLVFTLVSLTIFLSVIITTSVQG
jgi:uncharacterized membrane protein